MALTPYNQGLFPFKSLIHAGVLSLGADVLQLGTIIAEKYLIFANRSIDHLRTQCELARLHVCSIL
jgi:hypothetical protein